MKHVSRAVSSYELSHGFNSKVTVQLLSKQKLMKIPMFHTVQHEWYQMVTEGENGAYFQTLKKKDKKLNRKHFARLYKKIVFGITKRLSFEERAALTAEKFVFVCEKLSAEMVFFLLENRGWKALDLRKYPFVPAMKRSIAVLRALGVKEGFSGGIEPRSSKELAAVYKHLAVMAHYCGGFYLAFFDKGGKLSGAICDEGNPHITCYSKQQCEYVRKTFKRSGLSQVDCTKQYSRSAVKGRRLIF